MSQIWGVPPRLEVNAISCPVGLQQGAVSEALVLVRRWAPPPSVLTTQMFMLPERLLAKAMRFPSGLKAGAKAWLSPFSPLTLGVLLPSKMEARKRRGLPWR